MRQGGSSCLPALCGNQTWVREGGPPCFSEASEALGLTRASDKEREREVLTCHLLVCVT